MFTTDVGCVNAGPYPMKACGTQQLDASWAPRLASPSSLLYDAALLRRVRGGNGLGFQVLRVLG